MTEAHDLSFLSLFLQADVIVKGVMALLALASICCWTVIIDKTCRLGAVRRQVRRFESANRNGERLTEFKGDLAAERRRRRPRRLARP